MSVHKFGSKLEFITFYHMTISWRLSKKPNFSNISALLSKLGRAQHSDLVLTIFLEVSILALFRTFPTISS